MDETIKEALIQAMKEGDLKDFLKEQMKAAVTEAVAAMDLKDLIRDQVRAAVTEAVAAKDEEICVLREEFRGELQEVKDKLNDLEQYSRRQCLNISGLPESAAESTSRLVMDTAKLAGVAIAPGDIEVSHRVGTNKPGKIRPIIVRFGNFAKRQELYNARRELRKPRPFPDSTVTAEMAGKVFIADNLTRENQHTLYQARQMKKENKLFAAWSDLGKLKIRIRENGPTRIIKSSSDLMKLVNPETPEPARAAPRATAADADGYRRVTRAGSRSAT